MPSAHLWFTVAITLASANCSAKPEVLHHLPCGGADACTTSTSTDVGATTESSGDAEVTTVSTTVDPATTVDPDASSSGEGTSSTESTTTGVVDESSSTGEPVDNMYGPCSADEDCTSGYCAGGFCSTVCWSQKKGETPCPPAPDDAVGVTIVCGRINAPPPGGGPCEGCFDCGQYCIAVCDGGSTCPNGSSCTDDPCGGVDGYCG